MSLLAEQLVDEWLNLNGFFTRRGTQHGVHEIDLLGVRPALPGSAHPLEAWHVEVQVSFRPIGYLGRLTGDDIEAGAGKSKTSAKKRGPEILKAGIEEWQRGAREFLSSEDECRAIAIIPTKTDQKSHPILWAQKFRCRQDLLPGERLFKMVRSRITFHVIAL